jgi:large subunit ribosomal protein L22
MLMLVRGKSVAQSLATLRLVTKGARPLVQKVLESAFANSRGQDPEQWYVNRAWVGLGPQIKRMRAHAMGRGATIRHRTTHLTIVLRDEPAKRRKGERTKMS